MFGQFPYQASLPPLVPHIEKGARRAHMWAILQVQTVHKNRTIMKYTAGLPNCGSRTNCNMVAHMSVIANYYVRFNYTVRTNSNIYPQLCIGVYKSRWVDWARNIRLRPDRQYLRKPNLPLLRYYLQSNSPGTCRYSASVLQSPP